MLILAYLYIYVKEARTELQKSSHLSYAECFMRPTMCHFLLCLCHPKNTVSRQYGLSSHKLRRKYDQKTGYLFSAISSFVYI